MITKLSGKLKTPACNSFFLLLLIAFVFPGCKPKSEAPHPIEKVIGSMSDTLPVLTIPEDGDPKSENWKGADLEEEGAIPWSMRELKIFGILQNEKLIN